MTFRTFLRDKFHLIILHLACALLLSLFLYFTGTGLSELILLLICWGIILCLYLVFTYNRSNKQLLKIKSIMESLDKKYLFAEMISPPVTAMEREYYQVLKFAMKSMTEHVSNTDRKQNEYQQFIEQWIHEIKRPITGAKLICENNKDACTRKIHSQIEEIERHVERALYYARLGHVEKDYLIKKISLADVVEEVMAKNKLLLIQNNVCVDIKDLNISVYNDEKWLIFLLSQVITNCVQYKKDPAVIHISAVEKDRFIELTVRDNGIGIRESEIDRIFELGFTGSNGRNANNATGIGLYLCKELGKKLGIHLRARSELDHYTEIILSFTKEKQLLR